MRRRLALILGALALVLGSVGSASADVGLGLSLQTTSEQVCNENLCAQAFVNAHEDADGSSQVCLVIIHTNAELGNAEYNRETGCTDDPGTLQFAKGRLLLGFSATSITLVADLGGSRVAEVSSAHSLTSAIERSTDPVVLTDTPEPGCTTTDTYKSRHATVAGTVTIDGTALADTGDTWDIALWKTRVTC